MAEARNRGHQLKELALLALKRLDNSSNLDHFVTAMTLSNTKELRSSVFIRKMIYGHELEKTRICYSDRSLGYEEVSDGDFGIISPEADWIESVKAKQQQT